MIDRDYVIEIRVRRVNPTSDTHYDARTVAAYVRDAVSADARLKFIDFVGMQEVPRA